MPLTGRGQTVEATLTSGDSESNPLYISQSFLTDNNLYYQNMGLDIRLRQDNYTALISVGSLLGTSDYLNNVFRSIGMPATSNDDTFVRMSARGQIQISSTSANDTSAGTGARTVRVDGLLLDDNDDWISTSETFTLNGQTPVSSTGTTWYRINKMTLLTAGTSKKNEGEIYVSIDGAGTTGGIPDAGNTLGAMLTGFSTSSFLNYSVGSERAYVFNIGNFFFNIFNQITVRETFEQGGVNYFVGYYTTGSTHYAYYGAGSYTAKTDVIVDIKSTNGVLQDEDIGSMYVEFALVNTNNVNSSNILTFGDI